MERFIVGLERLIESTEQVVAASWRAARQVQAERAIETEGWRRQQLAHAARVAEMEREGEACIRHLEGEMDRLLAKVEERTTPMRLSRASSAVKIVRDSSVADETECGQSESARVQRRLDLSDESLATAIHGLAGATHRTVGTDRAKLPCLEESPSESLATLPHACNESSPSYPRTPDSEVPVPSRHRQAARTCVAELDVESLQETIQKKALADFAIEKKALEDALALAIRQRDAAVEQSEAAFKALKEVRRGQILSVKNFNAKGKEDAARRKRKEGNSESDESVRQQIVALKNKVLRRDLQIEKLKQNEIRLRDAAATVGQSAAGLREKAREEAQELMLERNALREENARLRQQMLKLHLRLEHEQEKVALYHLLRDEQPSEPSAGMPEPSLWLKVSPPP